MPELSFAHDGRRVLLEIAVLKPGGWEDFAWIPATALLDTGATVSGLGAPLIRKLGLLSYGKRVLKSAGDEAPVPYFMFRLGLFPDQSGPLADPRVPFVFADLDGFGWTRDADFEAILGMDVLRQCDLQMDRSGRGRLAFGHAS
jgi:hypothetical protein